MHLTMGKSRLWSSVVTVHANDNAVRLWSTAMLRWEKQMLDPSGDGKGSLGDATCALLSHCGHTAFVGWLSGVGRNAKGRSARSAYDKDSNFLAVATDSLRALLFDGANGEFIR